VKRLAALSALLLFAQPAAAQDMPALNGVVDTLGAGATVTAAAAGDGVAGNFAWFHSLWMLIATPIASATDQLAEALLQHNSTTFHLLAFAAMLLFLTKAIFSADDTTFIRWFRMLFFAAIVDVLSSHAAAFNYFVAGAIFGAINGVTMAIGHLFGGNGNITADTFDIVASKTYSVGLVVMKNLPGFSIAKAITLGFVVVFYWIAAEIAVAMIFLFYMLSFVTLQFLVALGPLFVAMAFFDLTRPTFSGWFRAVMSAALTQVFLVALLSLFTTTLVNILTQAASTNPSTGDAGGGLIGQIFMCLFGIVAAGFFAYLTYELLKLASAIAGAPHLAKSAYQQVASGAMAIGRSAASAVTGGSSATNAERTAADAASRTYAFQRTPPGSAP
jgi:type IV secretion system protein VirB6